MVDIYDDTPEKEGNKFYRQKGGALYYRFDDVGDHTLEGLKKCLDVSKQEKNKVIYQASTIGICCITSEMTRADAMNAFMCSFYIKRGADIKKQEEEIKEESPNDKNKSRIEEMKKIYDHIMDPAYKNSDFICITDFYRAANFDDESLDRIEKFCEEHDIDNVALNFHYEMALGEGFDIVASSDPIELAAKIKSEYGIPYMINKENIEELKEKLVLSPKDPRVSEARKNMMESFSTKSYQKE